ncbi:MAG: DUF5677 domain-containing protein [Candidatus Acidiferrum sp.]
MIPATAIYRSKVILPIYSKSLTVARAICSLVDEGFPAEAFAMSRTLVDIYFCVRYMSNKDTESPITTYVEYWAKAHEEWGNILAKHFPSTKVTFPSFHNELMNIAKKYKSKHLWTGHGGQAKLMALEEDTRELDEHGKPFKSEFDYDVIYFWTSQFVHVTILALDGHASRPGEVFKVRARQHAEDGRGKDALFNVLVFLSKIFICGSRIMREDQPEKILLDMQKLMKSYAKRKKRILP